MAKAKSISDWIESMLPMGVSIIMSALDNKRARAKFRSTFLTIFRGIKTAFIGDPDFQ